MAKHARSPALRKCDQEFTCLCGFGAAAGLCGFVAALMLAETAYAFVHGTLLMVPCLVGLAAAAVAGVCAAMAVASAFSLVRTLADLPPEGERAAAQASVGEGAS